MSDKQRPAAKQAADTTEDAPSALQAVQAALDRRDNGGSADRPATSADRPAPSADRPAPSADRPAPSADRPAPSGAAADSAD